jgi:hypothetical protein
MQEKVGVMKNSILHPSTFLVIEKINLWLYKLFLLLFKS